MFSYENFANSDKGGQDLILRDLFYRVEMLEKELREIKQQQGPMRKALIPKFPPAVMFSSFKKNKGSGSSEGD